MSEKILVRVVGGDHQRANGRGGFDTFPPGAVIEATAREVAAFAGRLVPATAPVAVQGVQVPPAGIPADQVPPAGTLVEGDDDGSQQT